MLLIGFIVVCLLALAIIIFGKKGDKKSSPTSTGKWYWESKTGELTSLPPSVEEQKIEISKEELGEETSVIAVPIDGLETPKKRTRKKKVDNVKNNGNS